jgi:hypothetical protein
VAAVRALNAWALGQLLLTMSDRYARAEADVMHRRREFAEALHSARKTLDLSLREAGALAGTSAPTIASMEHGKAINTEIAERLVAAYVKRLNHMEKRK